MTIVMEMVGMDMFCNDRIGTFTLNKLIICKSVEVKFRLKLEYRVYSKVHFDV
jgi:hypothetical protein